MPMLGLRRDGVTFNAALFALRVGFQVFLLQWYERAVDYACAVAKSQRSAEHNAARHGT